MFVKQILLFSCWFVHTFRISSNRRYFVSRKPGKKTVAFNSEKKKQKKQKKNKQTNKKTAQNVLRFDWIEQEEKW